MPTRVHHWSFAVIVIGLLAIAPGGCTSQAGGRLYESDLWRQHGGSLGKVTLIVAEDTTSAAPLNSGEERPATKFARAAKAALEKLPQTTLLDDPAPAKMAADLGDREAIALAKSRGAQSVCVLTVGTSGGRFTIGLLPPGWSVETFFLYSLRVLDVQTGDLLMHSVTYRQNGGMYQVYAADPLEVLQHDLKPPSPTTRP